MIRPLSFPHNIEYKEFRIGRELVLLDVATSNFFYVEPVVRDILRIGRKMDKEGLLRRLAKYSTSEINSALKALKRYRGRGIFLDKEDLGPLRPPPLNGVMLTLSVADDCNLACRYCYAKDHLMSKLYMTKQIGRKSIDFLLSYMGEAKFAYIRFFGGEPLLNFPVIKETILYARSRFKRAKKQVVFRISTNGTLINRQNIDFFKQHGVKLYVCIDGPAEVHNFHRPFTNGKGSYEAIVEKLRYLRELPSQDLEALFILSPFNVGRCREIFHHLRSLGFPTITFQPCFWSCSPGFNLGQAEFAEMKRQYRLLLKDLSGSAQIELAAHLSLIQFGLVSRPEGCGLGRSVITIDPVGDIYACHRLQGDPRLKIGNLKTGIDPKLQAYFSLRTCETNPTCRGCWARLLCGGGCIYENLRIAGAQDLIPPHYCKYIKFFIRFNLEYMLSLSRGNLKEAPPRTEDRYGYKEVKGDEQKGKEKGLHQARNSKVRKT
jgi:uncharacterized protein